MYFCILPSFRRLRVLIYRLVNGIVEFDQKLTILSSSFSVHQRSMNNKLWNAVLATLFLYFNLYVMYEANYFPPRTVDVSVVALYFFRMPYLVDFALIVSALFHLVNLACRFQTLNDCWARIPAGSRTVPDTASSMDYTRLLYAELSGLLRTFNRGFGPPMLGFFVLSFVDTIYFWFILICYVDEMTEVKYTRNVIKYTVLHIFKIQNLIFAVSIIVAVSNVNEKVGVYAIYYYNDTRPTSIIYNIIIY